jgi:secreted trypsin-like serine protease
MANMTNDDIERKSFRSGMQYGFVPSKALQGSNVIMADSNVFGFVVSLMRMETERPPLEYDHICSGSLISKRDVLIAAHCIVNEEKESVSIVAGSTDLRQGRKYLISWWITHELWNDINNIESNFNDNDIAIIRVSWRHGYNVDFLQFASFPLFRMDKVS